MSQRPSPSSVVCPQAKARKLGAIRDLLRDDMPFTETPQHYNFLTRDLRRQFGIVDTDNVSSNDYDPFALPPGVPAGLEATARYTAAVPSIWVNASHVCTCEVDPETGRVTLLRYIVSEDCGPMINPNVVEGQIAGGVVQGIGGALFEHLAHDEDGAVLELREEG